MKHRLVTSITGALAVPFFFCSLEFTSVAAEVRAPAPVAFPTGPSGSMLASGELDPGRVHYDEPGDGSLWALGASWKASFGPGGANYFPRVGAREPRSFPHALSPDRVTIGGVSLPFARTAPVVRNSDRVTLDHQSFVEMYDLAPDHVEQSFVFASSPGAGDLVLHIPVASELESVETESGLEFRSPRGRVTYSRAVAIDALGRRTSAETRIVDGAITIKVGADVLAGAAWPLVVDPILGAIFPDSQSEVDTFEIDTAYDAFHDVWVVVYERVFSAADHDVYYKVYGNNAAVITSGTVDFTSDSWVAPRIADRASAHDFLCVAGSTAASNSAKTVRGRIMQPNGTILTQGLQFSVTGSTPGDCIRPDVGGDPSPNTNWCVVFERVLSNSHQIGYCFAYSETNVVGPGFIASGADPEGRPSISKTNDGVTWMVAWEQQAQIGLGNILGARISNGGTVAGPFAIAVGSQVDGTPAASSPILGTNLTAVAWSRLSSFPNNRDIMVALLDGSTILQTVDLMTLESSPTQSEDQFEPSVDSDGEHFLVSYSQAPDAIVNARLFVTDLAVVGNTLQVVQNHLEPQPMLGLPERRSNVAGARVPGPLDHRYLVVYDITSNSTDHEVAGRFVDGLSGGTTSLFCFDTPGACPCGDSGLGVGGCANSVNAAGASLNVSGTPSTLGDTLVLSAGALPPTTTCLLFQGTTAGAPAIFGDGLRCVTGTVIRLAFGTSSAGGSLLYPAAGDPRVSVSGLVPVGGGTRAYQVWYRNAAAFCTSSTFNLTNGAIIGWAR